MKAVRLHSRGGFEQLVEEVVPLPDPATGEVRVRWEPPLISRLEMQLGRC